MEKAWFMVPMEYSPSGKYIIAPLENTLKVFRPNRKGMDLWKIKVYKRKCFEVIIVMVKDKKKYSVKDVMSSKISFMHDMQWTRKSNATNSFSDIWNGLPFFATFFFSLSLPIGKEVE